MKISYKVLKHYIPNISSVEEVAQNLVMHTAEVEDIVSEKDAFEHIVYGIIQSVEAHPNADSLRVCMVDIGKSELCQIVCGGSNLKVGQAVAVAKIGASVLWHGQGEPVIMKKTAIRGIESSGMICASEEIGLKDQFPSRDEKEILDLSHIDEKAGTNLAKILGKDDSLIEIDNKAINHRPDMFSHIGVAREVAALEGKKLNYIYPHISLDGIPDAGVKNSIPEHVQRYMALYIEGVKNIPSPEHILEILDSHHTGSKGILVDISNYSLYLYGQPTHCFDAEKVQGNIHIRFAYDGEKFLALNDKEYSLSSEDIVIADDAGVIALGGIIGGKNSAVGNDTQKIIVEAAHFHQATLRKTGKRLGIRTDALNIFEKDIPLSLQSRAVSLIIQELKNIFPKLHISQVSDVTQYQEVPKTIPYSLERIQKLIGKDYSEEQIEAILEKLEIQKKGEILIVPFWRKDLNHIADIAEEIARIDGYNKVQNSIPRITLGAISQSPLYIAKRQLRNFLVARGFYEMYTYSFTHEKLQKKALLGLQEAVELKNALSEEMSHLRENLIPNLLQGLEENLKDSQNLKLFEIEKVFQNRDGKIQEFYELGCVVQAEKSENLYYEMLAELDDICSLLQIPKYSIEETSSPSLYAHTGRVASIVLRGTSIGEIGEIHPAVLQNFDITGRVGYLRLNMESLAQASYQLIHAHEISSFQENRFDLNFVVDKINIGKKIQRSIENTDTLIQKVELFDIYESEEKLPGKRALCFTITIQSLTETLNDEIKNKLIQKIIANVEKIGGKLR